MTSTVAKPHSTKPAASTGKQFTSFSELSAFLWSIADLLRGDYKHHDFGKVILPFTVLRRLDCVLADTKPQVLKEYDKRKGGGLKSFDAVLNKVTQRPFHNISKLDLKRLLDDPNHIAKNLTSYVKGFSGDVRDIFIERFKLQEQVDNLHYCVALTGRSPKHAAQRLAAVTSAAPAEAVRWWPATLLVSIASR